MTGPVGEEVLAKGWESYKEAASKKGLTPISVSYNAEQGIAICETEANLREEVKAAHEEIGMVPAEIFEVKTAN